MAIRDKTQNKQNAQSLQNPAHYNNIAQHKEIQPNYYLLVTRVDSSTTELTYIFLKHSTNT